MMKCTSCDVPLCHIEHEGVGILTCPECRGKLVEVRKFRALAGKAEERLADAAKHGPLPVATAAPPGRMCACPKCSEPMDELALQLGGGTVRIDLCPRCFLIWFDRGELELAQVLAGRERAEMIAGRGNPAGRAAMSRVLRGPVRPSPPSADSGRHGALDAWDIVWIIEVLVDIATSL